MATYISLMKLTDQGIRDIKNAGNRMEKAKNAVASAGGKWIGFYMVAGEYDYVGITEFPSDEAGAAFILALGAAGNLRTTTMRAFTEQEFKNIISTLP
jgi:uncharacterized protein with GYD domain